MLVVCPAARLKTLDLADRTEETCFWGLPDLNPLLVSLSLQYNRLPAAQSVKLLSNALWTCSIQDSVLKTVRLKSTWRLLCRDNSATTRSTKKLNIPLDNRWISMGPHQVDFLLGPFFRDQNCRSKVALCLIRLKAFRCFDWTFSEFFDDTIDNLRWCGPIEMSPLWFPLLLAKIGRVVFSKTRQPTRQVKPDKDTKITGSNEWKAFEIWRILGCCWIHYLFR